LYVFNTYQHNRWHTFAADECGDGIGDMREIFADTGSESVCCAYCGGVQILMVLTSPSILESIFKLSCTGIGSCCCCAFPLHPYNRK
jgi:hypothetical protein